MRRIIAVLAAVGISITGLVAVPAQASVPADGSYNCSTSGTFTLTNGVVHTGQTCTGHANIPDGATALGQDAFYLSGLTTISMPNTLTSIGQSALRHISMTTVTIPSSVQTIGEIAFATTPLTSINFAAPSSLTTIGNYAFQSSRFTSITIPASLTSMGTGAFQLNTDLTNINFLGTVPSGGPWEAPSSVSISPPYLCTTGSFSVANNVVTDGSSCTGTANIPSGVTAIGASAFAGATSLSSVSLPNSLTTIGFAAFKGMTSLTAITIPSSVTSIGEQAFFDTRLTSLTIPSSVTSIANDTFGRMTALTSVSFPNTLTTIGGGAFYDNSALSSVTIPSGVSSIGAYAFGNTAALTSVTFLGNEPNTVDPDAFRMYGDTLRAQTAKAFIGLGVTGFASSGSTWRRLTVEQSSDGTYSCSTGLPSNATPNFTLTNGVVTQGQACSGAVVIPSVATALGSNAFNQATSMTSIEIPASVSLIGASAFTGASALVTIVVNASNADYSSAGGVLFNKAGTTLIKYPAGKTATSYTVGTLISEIAAGAFSGSLTLAGVNFEGNAPVTVGVDAFSGLAAGAKALVDPSATGFGNMGSTWNALTVASNVIAPPASSSPFQQPPIRPLPRVAGIQVRPGNSTQSSTVKLQLTGVEQGQSGQDIQIKIFDVKGNLFKILTVPLNGIAGSIEVALPMALGEFTVEANTIGAAGAATELVKTSSLIIRRAFHASPSSSRSPVLFGEAFARPITFAANSSVLTVRDRKALLLVAAELRKTRSSLAITGFTSRSGASRSFDRNLSSSRALSVARFLKAQGLSNILYVAGYGSISNTRSAESSRKVELRIIN